MQSRRLVLFLVCLIAWVALVLTINHYFFPTPDPEPVPLTEKQKDHAYAATLPAQLLLPPADAGIGQAALIATECALNRWSVDKKPFRYVVTTEEILGGVAGAGALFGETQPLTKPVSKEPRIPIVLGSDAADSEFHLGIVLDPLGAGVRRVVLNKFQQADAQGKPQWKLGSDDAPERDANGKKVPLPMELVMEQQYGLPSAPSFVLYHYDIDEPNSERPLGTLGNRMWKLARVVGDEALCKRVEKQLGENKANTKVEITSGEQQLVEYTTDIQDVRITKTFTLTKREYHIGLALKFQRVPGTPETKKTFRYQLAGAHGVRVEGQWYNTSVQRQSIVGIAENETGFRRPLEALGEITKKEGGDEYRADQTHRIVYAAVGVQFFASAVVVDDQQPNRDFLGAARATLETRLIPYTIQQEIKPTDATLKLTDPKDPGKTEELDLAPGIAKLLSAIPKNTPIGLLARPGPNNRLEVFDVKPPKDVQPLFYNDITVRLMSKPVELKDEPVEHKFLLYNGPVKVRLLHQMEGGEAVPHELVDRYEETLRLNTLTDWHSPNWMGSVASTLGITWLLIRVTNVMHAVLGFLHGFIPVYGICIIVLTICVRGMMFPVSRKQAMTSMKMQALAPELKKLQEKFKDDRQAYGLAQMELFRKHGINPFGSCWMVFLQMPIFMGLYYALQESIFFRLSPFLWLDNLAAPDMLFEWGSDIPFVAQPESFGSFYYLGPFLNLLPVVAVTLMIFQQKMMMPPAADEQQAMQQKMMKWMMIVFGVMFYKVAGGLCVYFIASSVWGFCERKLLPKKKLIPVDGPTPPEPPASEGLLTRWLGAKPENGAPSTAIQETPPGAVQAGPSKAQRRQERERRKQTRDSKEGIAPKLPDGADAGWWGNFKQRVRTFWEEVQRQAEKKRQAERKK